MKGMLQSGKKFSLDSKIDSVSSGEQTSFKPLFENENLIKEEQSDEGESN